MVHKDINLRDSKELDKIHYFDVKKIKMGFR